MAAEAPTTTAYAPPPTHVTAEYPAPAAAPGQAVPVDDVTDWINRVKGVVEKPETVTAPAPAGAVSWHERFVMFFEPVDTAVITCCCPCVTFGKTHHRLRKDANLKEYSAVNPSCLGFWVASIFCCSHIGLIALQRHDLRTQHHLQGDCVMDLIRACCCPCCDLVQQDKESAYQAIHQSEITVTQPTANVDMKLPIQETA